MRLVNIGHASIASAEPLTATMFCQISGRKFRRFNLLDETDRHLVVTNDDGEINRRMPKYPDGLNDWIYQHGRNSQAAQNRLEAI